MDIYIKPSRRFRLENGNKILVKDIAEVYTTDDLIKMAQETVVMEISERKNKSYIISAIDIISEINKTLPGNTVHLLGDADTIIEFAPNTKKDNPIYKWLKICFISIVLAAGSATAIMSFHTDAQIPVILKNYYYMVFKKSLENPALIEIPYSIGLAFGIIVFFNHFIGKKITEDPTPIEVEMTTYENSVTDTKIEMLRNSGDGKNESGV